MNRYDYIGNKTKNYFTAYLQKCIKWKRWNYLKKKENISRMEKPLKENMQMEYGMSVEEMADIHCKEDLLLKENNREYPKWSELSDERLVVSLLLLQEDERRIIYQHVFEEKSFEEISNLNGITKERTKGIYYFAIRKIRNWMRGER